MDANQFDRVARFVGYRLSRRAIPLLGATLAPALLGPDLTTAKKKKKKKSPFCLSGQTVEARGKQKKKLTKQGATPGACPPPPPPPPTACTPRCGTSCGGSNGCGGTCTCAAGSICSGGTCRACTVTCNSDPQTCGEQLGDAMANGGTIVACPGRYGGNISWTSNTSLIGAGPGNDPATSTILDGQQNGRVLFVNSFNNNVTAVLNGVRLTNGLVTGISKGGGISALAGSDLQLTNCAVVDNDADAEGGGNHTRGSLQLIGSRVAANTTIASGGGIFLEGALPSSIANSIIEDNESLNDSGGGIYSTFTNITITGSTIQRNNASQNGGGLRLVGGDVTFDNASRIINNTALLGTGGGIRATNEATAVLNGADASSNDPNNCSGTGITGCSG